MTSDIQNTIIFEPKPRYIIEIGDTVSFLTGGRAAGAWNFHAGTDDEAIAKSMAYQLAKEHEYVRVIERSAIEENNE